MIQVAQPVQMAVPSTPTRNDDLEVVVHNAPTPGAIKFMDTMTDVGSKVGKLAPTDISDGMYELSCRLSDGMKSSYSTFSTHALDLAIIASSDPQAEQTRMGALRQQVDGKKLAMLPVAAMYAMVAAVCMVIFAVIYYPKLYGPKLFELAKAKVVEHKIDQHALTAVNKLREKSAEAYAAARSSEVTAKGLDYLGKANSRAYAAYSAAASTPIATTFANKSSELAEKGRAKLAEKLVALRDGAPAREPQEPQTPV